MLHTVIMAGGSGTRFWPASRRERPKQFLSLFGSRSLIQLAWDRSRTLVPAERCWVVTGEHHAPLVREQLPDLPAENILVEPCPRNTAACIGLAAVRIRQTDPAGVMAVLPSDQLIQPPEAFATAIRTAEGIIAADSNALVLFGIRPTYPATGFGYIETGNSRGSPPSAFPVARFREKPDRQTAESFLASGGFLWNSGIFVWRAARLLDALAHHEPAIARGLDQIATSSNWSEGVRTHFPALPSISIDYAVLERDAASCRVVEARFEWDDVGSWEAVARRSTADAQGNFHEGLHVGVETGRSIVRTTDEHLVATIGVDDLLIVHTPDATLVARRNDEEGLRNLIAALTERGLEYLL